MSSNPTSTSTGRAGRRIPLRSRRGRAALAGAVLLVALPVLSACAAGEEPEVYQIQPDNGEGKAGFMYISNVWVVLDSTTGDAEVVGQVANTDPTTTDTNSLTSVTVGGAAATIVPPSDTSQLDPGVQVTSSSVAIPGMAAVQFGETGQPELEVPNADLTVGANAQVVYTFSGGQTVTVTAIIEPNSGLWASYAPGMTNGTTATGTATPLATGTATVKATGTATAKATGTAKASDTAKASGSASASVSSSAS